jgi:glutamine cyclotransferase
MAQKINPKSRVFLIISIALVMVLVILGVVLVLALSQPDRVVSSIPLVLEQQMTYEVVNAFPHDPDSFTQGLIFLDGVLYESTGLYGESSLRRVALETGEVQRLVFLPDEVFGEGLTDWEETLVQLTWREGIGYVYNRDDFSHLTQFNYETEGWGLTQDGENLIMSDGSATLFFLDPETYAILSTVDVLDEDAPVTMLNELEYIQGEIFANIWQTDTIVRIDPETGAVKGWIDLGGLLPEEERTYTTNVLNGIAYDPETDRLFVTGKRWPKIYEIRLVPIGADH